MGKAPLSNPAKAPGLWQKFKISFRAPRFDAAGNKIENARFVYVDLNGIRIHDNVEVPLPTGGPIENNEKPTGPLMIQGDHGPVAIRNIRYTAVKPVSVTVRDVAYQTWYGNYKLISDFVSLPAAASGKLTEVSCEVLENEDAYGSRYTGTITVSDDADYRFLLAYTGGARLTINNQQLINSQSGDGWWPTNQPRLILKLVRILLKSLIIKMLHGCHRDLVFMFRQEQTLKHCTRLIPIHPTTNRLLRF